MSLPRKRPPFTLPGTGYPTMLIRAATSILVALLVAAGASQGCGATSELASSGMLTVKVMGLGTSPAPSNGGTVSVTTTNVSSNVAFPATLPDSGAASASVPAGDYTITYTPPNGYLLASSQVATQTVHVTGAAPTEVDFNVVVAPSPTGTLTIQVTGLGDSAASGGSAAVLRTDVTGQTAQTYPVPTNGSINLTVVAGTYRVTYTAPNGYKLASGVTNPVSGKVVSAGGTGTASFAVQAISTTGTLQVNVTGLTGSPANGGSAVAQRTDSAGSQIVINVSASGSGTSTSVPPGTYTITYTPPSGFGLASGATNPVTGKVVTAGGTATVSFAVQAGVSTGTLQVNVTGLTGSPANGGSAVAQRTDAAGSAITINVTAAGSGTNPSVPAGTYTITYTPPTGFTVAGGVTNPVTGKVVSAGGTATVSFAVTASSSSGTIQVNVTGLSGTSTGGSASAQRTDAAGSPITINVLGTGSGSSSSVPPGTYTITYTAPSGFALASGVTNPVTGVAVTGGATATVSFTVTTGSFATPDIINNASFETGWDGFTNGNSGTPQSVTRDTTRAYDGKYSVRFHITPTSGDGGGDFLRYFTSGYDHVWARFYFYFDNANAPNGPFKFNLWWDTSANQQFGGFYVEPSNGMYIQWLFLADWPSGSGVDLVPLSSLANGWHSLEVDYWRNGDTSNGGHDYPSAFFWLDGQPITTHNRPPDTGVWMADGRLNAGARGSSAKIGLTMYMATLNGGNSTTGNVWIDRIAWSTLGRIGP